MVRRFTNVKRWLRRNILQATLLLALFINAIALSPAFPSSLKIDCCSVTPQAKVSTAMQGAKAYFDGATNPCMLSKRRFLNMMVGSKMSSASSILKDNAEDACFEGEKGALIIALEKPTLLASIDFRFRKDNFDSFHPKDIMLYGSDNHEDGMEPLMTVRIKQHSKYQHFTFKGPKTPIKYLKVVILNNWGGSKTLIQNITLRGAGD